MHTEAYNEGYTEGYVTGYSWLTRGDNFKHPNAGGYIPGGPFVLTMRHNDKPEYKVKAQKSLEQHYGWRVGWIDGINAYIYDNKLHYAKVEYPNELRGWSLK